MKYMRTIDEKQARHAEDAQEHAMRAQARNTDDAYAEDASDASDDTLATLDSVDSFLQTHDYGKLLLDD